jgi:hypothetical protein
MPGWRQTATSCALNSALCLRRRRRCLCPFSEGSTCGDVPESVERLS